MYRLSSNFTIFWKLFVPIFYITLFGLLNIMALTIDPGDVPFLANPITQLVLIICYITFIIVIMLTIARLLRVESDDHSIYVSNYLKSYRYKIEDIENVSKKDFGFFTVTSLTMKEKTKFGKKLRFLGDWDKKMK
jgi:hypothetical protein